MGQKTNPLTQMQQAFESHQTKARLDLMFLSCMNAIYKNPSAPMSQTDKEAVGLCTKKLLTGFADFSQTWEDLRPHYELPADEEGGGDGDDEDDEDEDDD